MLLLALCSAVPAHAALSWNVQIVDANAAGIGNGYCPIAVGSNNTPHIGYTRQGYHEQTQTFAGHFVKYASWNGSGWSSQQVSPGLSGDACDLVLDTNGNPHILYETGGLTHADWTGTEWTSQTITANDVIYASLALDSAGNPHAAYNDGQGLKYASWTGSSWNIQTVDTSPIEPVQSMLSLAFDSNNTPYIMYFNQSTYADSVRVYGLVSVKLAVLKNSGWSIEPVLASYNLSDCGNMVLDSKGYPHFLCTQPQPPTYLSTILYARWNGSAWNSQTVVSDAYLTSAGFLALDSHDNPNIAYITSDVEVMYANWTGTTWDIQNAGTVPDANGPCYLALDSNGIPHISFRGYISGQAHGQRNATIFYATATGSTEPTQPPSPTSPASPILLVSAAVIIGAVVTVVVYVWKKKTKH
jgi:hypothetical protein